MNPYDRLWCKWTRQGMHRRGEKGKREWFCRLWHKSLLFSYPSWLTFLVLLFASVLSLVVALDGTCSPFMLHRNATCFKMAHPHEPSQEGLLCLPAYSQVYGGDLGHYMRRAGKDYCEAQISSHMSICSFVQWGKWGAMPQFCKITSSWLLLYMFLTKLSKTDCINMEWSADVL